MVLLNVQLARDCVPYLRTIRSKRMMADISHPSPVSLSRAQGCLAGQIAGDSLGSLVGFETSASIEHRYPGGVRLLTRGGTWGTIAGQPTEILSWRLRLPGLWRCSASMTWKPWRRHARGGMYRSLSTSAVQREPRFRQRPPRPELVGAWPMLHKKLQT